MKENDWTNGRDPLNEWRRLNDRCMAIIAAHTHTYWVSEWVNVCMCVCVCVSEWQLKWHQIDSMRPNRSEWGAVDYDDDDELADECRHTNIGTKAQWENTSRVNSFAGNEVLLCLSFSLSLSLSLPTRGHKSEASRKQWHPTQQIIHTTRTETSPEKKTNGSPPFWCATKLTLKDNSREETFILLYTTHRKMNEIKMNSPHTKVKISFTFFLEKKFKNVRLIVENGFRSNR